MLPVIRTYTAHLQSESQGGFRTKFAENREFQCYHHGRKMKNYLETLSRYFLNRQIILMET